MGVDEGEPDTVAYANRQRAPKKYQQKERASVKSREWIMHKKERLRKQGKKVVADSKYTGRRRPAGF
jgi:hypothetical protein